MDLDMLKKFVIDNKTGIIVGAIAGFIISRIIK